MTSRLHITTEDRRTTDLSYMAHFTNLGLVTSSWFALQEVKPEVMTKSYLPRLYVYSLFTLRKQLPFHRLSIFNGRRALLGREKTIVCPLMGPLIGTWVSMIKKMKRKMKTRMNWMRERHIIKHWPYLTVAGRVEMVTHEFEYFRGSVDGWFLKSFWRNACGVSPPW